MNMKNFSLKNSLLTLFSISLLFTVFMSCSQNLPDVGPASSSIIFEYADEESLPQARLSVFVEAISDPHRFATLKIRSEENGYEWETDNLINIVEDDKTMSGYTNFVMPEGEKIPTGKYTAIYINADEEETEKEFYIDYNKKIYDLKSTEIPAFMRKSYSVNKISIYDDAEVLIFFGDRTQDFKTTRDIWNNYQNASYFNDIWYTSGNSIICILPKQIVKPEKVEAAESKE